MSDSIILAESDSPVCPIRAYAEQTENAVYFYLFNYIADAPGNVKTCWVCNRKPAPDALTAENWPRGTAPMMPRSGVKHDLNGIDISPEGLKILWFETGDSALLMQKGNVLAVIPPWSGYKDFHGYARYAAGTQPYAWEMNEQARDAMLDRAFRGDMFWEKTADGSYWPEAQAFHLRVTERFFGKHTQYYAIDEGKFPPRAVIEGKKDGVVYGFTAGISHFVMPQIEMYVKNANEHHRIEFGFAVKENISAIRMEAYNCFMSLAKCIHRDLTFFAHGHTNTWNGIPGFHAFLFVNARALRGIEAPAYGNAGGDPVNLLWAVPITKEEYDFVVKTNINELMKHAKDLSLIHIFDGQPKFAL